MMGGVAGHTDGRPAASQVHTSAGGCLTLSDVPHISAGVAFHNQAGCELYIRSSSEPGRDKATSLYVSQRFLCRVAAL